MSAQARKRLQLGVYALSFAAALALMFALVGTPQTARGEGDDDEGGGGQTEPTATPEPAPEPTAEPLPTPAPNSYYGAGCGAYNLEAIDEDEDYYSTVDASRMHQFCTEDRHELPELQFVSDGTQLTTVSVGVQSLTVRAEPGRPVTYYAMDGGVFTNEQPCITIKADQSGLASTSFYAGQPGTYRVQVASPENNGPFAFQIIVRADE